MKTSFKVMESTNLKMVKRIKDNGKIIKCMVKESIHGLMEENMKVNFIITNNMDLEWKSGLMEAFMKEIG